MLAITLLLLLHTPPVTASVKVIDEPIQADVAPVMVPADAPVVTLTTAVADTEPHALVTV